MPKNQKKRREYIDYDYEDTLSLEHKEYLKKFTQEFYGGNFKYDDTPLHSDEYREGIFDMNNALIRDSYSIAKTGNRLIEFSDENESLVSQEVCVDMLLDSVAIANKIGTTQEDILSFMDHQRLLNGLSFTYKIPLWEVSDFIRIDNGKAFRKYYGIARLDYVYMRRHSSEIRKFLKRNKLKYIQFLRFLRNN